MRAVRWILGKIILAWEANFPPQSIKRAPEAQAKVDAMTARFALYQFAACPFCVKVRRAATRLNVKVDLRDTLRDAKFAEELVREGGSDQVPCLRIATPSGEVKWLYESSEIVSFLEREIAAIA